MYRQEYIVLLMSDIYINFVILYVIKIRLPSVLSAVSIVGIKLFWVHYTVSGFTHHDKNI